MIREIIAKQLLSSSKEPDPFFGMKYTMNIYRGCRHQCIYCDSRSECYQIENFEDILVKVNAADLLRRELRSKRTKGTIGTGSMSDPYARVEERYGLTRKALAVIADMGFPVHIITKGELVVRDLDILQQIGDTYAAVSFTITTYDDELAARIEPGAPSPSRRFAAMQRLSAAGIYTGITMMPILPYIEDSEENITEIVKRGKTAGAGYILPALGVTLRDRQRAYFYRKLDEHFPGIREKYQQSFGTAYECNPVNCDLLWEVFREACGRYGMAIGMQKYTGSGQHEQLSFFENLE